MDDTTILRFKTNETRRMLAQLDNLMSWCRTTFTLKKSRSLSVGKEQASVGPQAIDKCGSEALEQASVGLQAIDKCGSEALEQASVGLQAIDKCRLQRNYKMQCLQITLILRLLWPSLLCDIITSTVESMEAKISKHFLEENS
ncbi:reverse transcriptase [Plakobranchus ocellatus]|uniref:Reverse transcriptase n=1 Tax=Plakobranchus ocellatus TaxID=259542 RepID=A0AAV4BC64_9GAST|nr:reverse transcriptase [Plakobranchus ocellatus]